MSWKLIVGVLCLITGVFIPLGIVLILLYVIQLRKKSKSVDRSNDWNDETFINSLSKRDLYEHRYY